MPPTLSSRNLLWTGIVLTVVGLAARLYLMSLVFVLWGNDALNNPAQHWTQILLAQVAFQLGLALIAFFFVVRAIELNRVAGSTPANGSVHEGTAPDAASAQRALVRMFWTGVALVVLGLILQESLAAWQYDLSATADVGGGLARDILWLVGAPLEAVAVPLGILLAAGSLVPRTLELANTERSLR